MASNLPPGAARSSWATIDCECRDGHRWDAPAYSELGGLFWADEERGPYCPQCSHIDVGTQADLGPRWLDEVGNPMPGYEFDTDGVWRMPEPAEPDLVEPPEGCDDDVDPSVAAQR